MKFVACIGSRKLKQSDQDLCESIGRFLANQGYIIKTGNADGADQAYARGANSVSPSNVWIYLPWKTYNAKALVEGNKIVDEPKIDWYSVAAKYHLYWKSLSSGDRRLHARNVGIVEGVEYVVAFPSVGFGGGTAMGMRLGGIAGLRVYNLREEYDREFWENKIESS